jgi:two-component system response regulator BaeR
MMNILIVEDDLEIADSLNMFLHASGFDTEHLASGEKVIETVKDSKPDLILLDVMLPNVDGVTCCKRIREFSDVPIIIMTAKVEEIDRLIGLEAGADDYVCKPFSAMELILRIKAILKRSNKNSSQNEFMLNHETYQVFYQNNVAELTHVEFSLFNLLYSRPRQIFSRNQILDLAYPDSHDISDRTIDTHIKNIRNKVKQLGVENSVIDSVYGVGYKYVKPE